MHNSRREELKNKYKDEKVFIVPFDSVKHIEDKFTSSDRCMKNLSKYDVLGTYALRYDVEYNPSFQQLIPYTVIYSPQRDQYYVARRIGGDARLENSLSLGFGGHINPCDGNNNVIHNALKRELEEEVDIKTYSKDNSPIMYLGNIRDLTSETSDHLGFVFQINVKTASIKEKDKLKGLWMSKKELIDSYFEFESWSKLIIDHLYEQN